MPARSPSVFFVVGGALAGLLLALGGCNAGGSAGGTQAEVTRRVQRGVTPGQRSLVFDHYSGDITLRDTAAREADLTFVKHARAASREAARKLLGRIRIEERGGSGEFAYKITSGAAARTSVDVQGRVSRKTRLRLYLRDGDLALSGLRGPLDATNENGNVRIGGAAQSVRAETRNGAVEVGMRRVPPEGEVRLKTQNGDLRLTLPASASADVAARTDAGDIDVGRDLDFSDRERDAGGAGGRFEGELGKGGARVRLRTANGDIALRRGTMRRLPGLGRPSPPRDTTQRDTTQRDTTQRDTTQRDTARRDSLPTPPMLRRPDAQQDDDAGAAGADTGDTAAPMLPGRDTTQQ